MLCHGVARVGTESQTRISHTAGVVRRAPRGVRLHLSVHQPRALHDQVFSHLQRRRHRAVLPVGRAQESAEGHRQLGLSVGMMRKPGSSTAMQLSGTLLWMTAFAPIFTLWPTVILPKSRAPGAMYTLSPITGTPALSPEPLMPIVTFCESAHPRPSTAREETVMPPKWPMKSPGPTTVPRGISMPHTIWMSPFSTK